MSVKKNNALAILEKSYKMPKFSVVDSYGELVSNKNLLGKWNVIYFYPKDLTSGCTIEANDFQKKIKSFENLACDVYGISKDSCQSHQKFLTKEGIKFKLLSDEQGNMLESFGVWKEKSMYGKKFMGVERSTFLVNPEGFIVAEWRKVKVTEHVENVFKTLKELIKS